MLGLIGVFSSLGAYREMNAAKDQLFSAVESLEKGDLEPAAAGFTEARANVEKADSKLNSNIVGTGFLKIVPYAGTQVKALNSFIQIADHLSKAGIMATEAFREVPGLDEVSPQGQVSIATMVDLLPKLAGDLAPVEQELLLAREESRAMKTRWLVGRASALKGELDEKLDEALGTLQKARELMAAVPGIVGEEGAPPKNYMVLQQDPYELRASGGLISTYGILECTHDSLNITEYKRANKLVGLTAGEGVIPPLQSLGGWMVSYGIAPTLCFWDAGWWPDFPLTTDILSTIWSKNGKVPVDGYIAVDPIAIGYVLEQIGPLEVPEFGETVTAENLSSLILEYKEVRKGDAFLKSLSELFFQKVVGSDPGQWFSLGRAFGRALDEKHMLLYFKDPEVEQCFSELDWSGEVKETDGDYLMAVDCNVGGNEVQGYKANYFIKPTMSVEITRRKDLTLRHHVTYTFDNTSGATEFPLTYKSYLRLYVPEGAVVEGAVDVTASGLMDSGSELGKHVFGKLVDVPVGQVVNVEFDYVTPGYESILLEKQCGVANMNVKFVYVEDGSIKKTEEVQLKNETRLDLSE
ncbi:MAG: DUF4012 domain-containing protein [Actinomycetia bacterium]|nr:DUF4012 domain-containing protein [Actinomycetes bacterium]